MEEGGQSSKLRDFMQGMSKENNKLLATCAAEKAAGTQSLLEVSALEVEGTAQKKMIE